jgi:hypothetical protein
MRRNKIVANGSTVFLLYLVKCLTISDLNYRYAQNDLGDLDILVEISN